MCESGSPCGEGRPAKRDGVGVGGCWSLARLQKALTSEICATPTPYPSPLWGGELLVQTGYIVDRSDRIDG